MFFEFSHIFEYHYIACIELRGTKLFTVVCGSKRGSMVRRDLESYCLEHYCITLGKGLNFIIVVWCLFPCRQ